MNPVSTAKPVIGLSTYAQPARWGAWDAPAALLPLNYAEQVAAAGGVPVLLPPVPGIAGAVGRLDGLVLTGGGDIDPARYGASPHPRTGRANAERDRAELDLLAAALATGLPVLGICRGLQLLNVAQGGTLHQHLADLGQAADAGHTPQPGTFGSHPVRVAAGSLLADILQADGPLAVPTAHHQAIDRLGANLAATAWAADGVIEAIELTGGEHHPFVVAVQWHPEAGDDLRLSRALVAAAQSALIQPRGMKVALGRRNDPPPEQVFRLSRTGSWCPPPPNGLLRFGKRPSVAGGRYRMLETVREFGLKANIAVNSSGWSATSKNCSGLRRIFFSARQAMHSVWLTVSAMVARGRVRATATAATRQYHRLSPSRET